jgi:uncharacterized membrane protein (DUF2068 family)
LQAKIFTTFKLENSFWGLMGYTFPFKLIEYGWFFVSNISDLGVFIANMTYIYVVAKGIHGYGLWLNAHISKS